MSESDNDHNHHCAHNQRAQNVEHGARDSLARLGFNGHVRIHAAKRAALMPQRNQELENEERQTGSYWRKEVQPTNANGQMPTEQHEITVLQRLSRPVEQERHQQGERDVYQGHKNHIDDERHQTMHRARVFIILAAFGHVGHRHPLAEQHGHGEARHRTQRIGHQIVDIELTVGARVEAPETAELRAFDEQRYGESANQHRPPTPAQPPGEHETKRHEQHHVHYQLQYAAQSAVLDV